MGQILVSVTIWKSDKFLLTLRVDGKKKSFILYTWDWHTQNKLNIKFMETEAGLYLYVLNVTPDMPEEFKSQMILGPFKFFSDCIIFGSDTASLQPFVVSMPSTWNSLYYLTWLCIAC